MIPHSSAGVQPWRHPSRAVSGGAGRVGVSPALGQFDRRPETLPTPLSHPRPLPVIDLPASSHEPQEREPPAKRQRLDAPIRSPVGDVNPTSVGPGELRNTSGIAPSRPPSVSWRTRPVWSFQALVSEMPAVDPRGGSAAALAQSGESAPLPPLPTLPWKYAPRESSEAASSRSREGSPSKDVQTVPYRIQVPEMAPVLNDNQVGDFSPWTGNHPEDVLNEQTAKQGHYDRTQVSQNESNTARPSLYAQLKHRSGLQMLSSVFAAALEKRQNHNVVNTPSTFKPPPRVTLTDNKREAWLRDLANSSVPLRKLSRTIPHGIRGKILLEQCLSKWIPVGRAVWLAKCVGANEIRAFKRKGTSGALAVGLEGKWVRDWTSGVQQFVEGVLGACGAPDWKLKMRYAVSLTARLFFEHLLDHDHYLEWFLSSLEAASISSLPIWLLMLGIYWDNILRYRKRGRRLAEILLAKLHEVCRDVTESEHAVPHKQLTDQLSCCIKRLAREHTSSMVLPNSFDRYKDLVLSCLDLKENVDTAVFQSLVERNTRVQRPRSCQRAVQFTPRQRVIRLLDSKQLVRDIPAISAACLNTIEDRAALVSCILEWSASPFRTGFCRVYTSVRLLRKWKISGIDVDSYILSFLTEMRGHYALNMDNVYHTIAELVRSQTFSVGRYLQWFMARGVSSCFQTGQEKAMSGDVGLIAQIPANRLPEHVYNLRNTLLARAGASASDEAATIAAVKATISCRLPKVFEFKADAVMPCDIPHSGLTWAVKAEIGQWVRRGVAEHYIDSNREIAGVDATTDPGISALTPDEFYKIRGILENFEDLSMLADVLKHATNSDDSIVLASAADTINHHLDPFYVIGATTDLFRRLFAAYCRLKRLGTASLDLLFSLIELGLQIPSECNAVSVLRQEFSRIETKSVLAVSSPVSDHVPDISSETDPSLPMKLDQILSSGGCIDEATLDNIFNVLTKASESGSDETKLPRNDICRYLAQLRCFHPKRFDSMLVRWICGVIKSSPPTLLKILPPLIGVGCVTFQAFMSLVERLSRHGAGGQVMANMNVLKMDLLELLVPQSSNQDRCLDLLSYRFQSAQQEFLVNHSAGALNIIRDAAASADLHEPESGVNSNQRDLYMVKLLSILLTQSPENSAKDCMHNLTAQHPAFIAALQKALDHLLGFDMHTGQNPKASEAEKVIQRVDDFSLPFCQLKLQILFNAGSREEDRNDIVDIMFKAAVTGSSAKRSHWADLVAPMSQDAVRQIRERAEKGFFSIPLLENPNPAEGPSGASRNSLETAKLYLTIIEELAGSIPDAGVQSIAPILVEKMDLLLHKLIVMQTNFNNFARNRLSMAGASDATTRLRANFERAIAFWFSALLRMVVIHRPAFTVPASAPKLSNLPEQTRLLVSIFCISLSRRPSHSQRLPPTAGYFPHATPPSDRQPCPGILMQTHALDVAASLIDTFPAEARYQCVRFLKEKCQPFMKFQNDPRFAYLLGPIPDSPCSTSLQPPSLPSPAASGSTPTPTPGGNAPFGPQQPAASTGNLATALSEGANSLSSHFRLQYRGRTIGPYPLRPWELLEDAAPIVGVNDTAVSLGYFDARRVRA